jgi:tetratricopeptide (TPR) repeat protein
LMGVFSYVSPAEVMPKAKALAERALAIDPGLAEAWSTLGAIAEQYDRAFAQSDSHYQRALAIDPRHSSARAQRALWRVIRGAMPMDKAIAEMRQAMQDDPLNAWVVGMHSYVLGIADRHAESIAEAERAMGLDPDSFFAHFEVMRSHAWAGDYDRAIAEAPGLCDVSGRHSWALGMLAWTHGKAGHGDQARACYDELEARSRHEFVAPSWLAVAAGSAGLIEEAMGWVERGVTERDPLVLWSSLPYLDSIRAHPRFAEVTRVVCE